MYVVKPYKGDLDNIFFGVYIKSDYAAYKIDYLGDDNLVVLCHSLEIAETIARLLNTDNKLFENKDN